MFVGDRLHISLILPIISALPATCSHPQTRSLPTPVRFAGSHQACCASIKVSLPKQLSVTGCKLSHALFHEFQDSIMTNHENLIFRNSSHRFTLHHSTTHSSFCGAIFTSIHGLRQGTPLTTQARQSVMVHKQPLQHRLGVGV